jgi:YHS domain-containing protein
VQIPRLTLFVLFVLLLTILARPVLAFEETNASYFGGVALDGYDAVSYFTESKAVKGNKAYTAEWKGATWRFSSETNRRRFTASPGAFAPQYGGYCSNQMSLGNLSDVDIEVWRIIDKKLYLFGHDAGRVRWASETGQRILDADQHWISYLGR